MVKGFHEETDLIEAMVRNITYSIFYLEPYKQYTFLDWVRNHTGLEVVENGKLNGRLAAWLKSLPEQQALREGTLIMSEILWFEKGLL